jgi:hypothetical protein
VTAVETGPEIATLRGEQCVRDNAITELPVDPFDIAKKSQIEVYEKPSKPGVSGMLIRVGDAFAIAYATHIPNPGFQRFSVGHELGHYFLDGHVDHILGADGVHESRAGFASGNQYEREADLFAVGLLMPRALFTRALRSAGDGIAAIDSMARNCGTSLVATAIRVAELTEDAIAVVVTNQDEIEFAAMSKSFRDLKVTWLKRGDPVPRRSLTSRFNGDPGRILHADREEGSTDLEAWFDVQGRNADLLEQVVGLGKYEKTLTVLSVQNDVEDDEEAEQEEKELERSWTPTLGRSRRK